MDMKQILLNQIAEARAQIAQLSSDVSSTAMDVSFIINVYVPTIAVLTVFARKYILHIPCLYSNSYLHLYRWASLRVSAQRWRSSRLGSTSLTPVKRGRYPV